MTSAALTLLGNRTQEVIDQPETAEHIPEKVMQILSTNSKASVGGFEVISSLALWQYRASRRSNIVSYVKARNELDEELKALGVQAIAFTTKSIWEKLCAETGLIRLSPDESRRVRISSAWYEAIRHRASFVAGLLSIVSITLLYLTFFLTAMMLEGAKVLVVVPVTALTLFLILSVISIFKPSPMTMKISMVRDWLMVNFCRRYFESKPWTEQLQTFFPDNVDFRANENSLGMTLALPRPPADVLLTLTALADKPIQVAVTPDALRFTETPSEVIRRITSLEAAALRNQRRLEAEARRRQWGLTDGDPVLYLTRGNVVAVVAQFGPFPAEQALVERLANAEHLF